MTLEIKKLPKSEMEISDEISAEEFAKYWPKALEDLSKGAKLPGFREGKVPEKVLVQKIGETVVLERAAELAIQDALPKIVKERKIEIVGYPRASITKIAKGEALGYKLTFAVLPEIKMPKDFKEIASDVFKKKEEVKVEDKEIDDAIDYLRKSRAAASAPKVDDKGEGEPAKEDAPKSSASEQEEKKEELPELNDEFAQSLGEFKTVQDLKDSIRKNLQAEKESKLKEKKRLEAMDAILKKSEVEIPDVLIEGEKNKMLQEFQSNITRMGLKWEDYLTHVKKKEEELLEGWTEDALRRVKYGLLLRQFDKDLKIDVTDEELEKKCKEFGVTDDTPEEQKTRAKDYIYGVMRNDKIFEVLGS